jgi:excisionase family DNA binding protein
MAGSHVTHLDAQEAPVGALSSSIPSTATSGPFATRAREVAPIALRPAEAAAALGVSRRTFDALVLPSLRVVRLGRRIVIPVAELHRYVEREAAVLLRAEL